VRRGGYIYQENCYEIFEDFFLKVNPFYDIIDTKGTEVEGSFFGTAFGGMNEPPAPPMDDVHITVECSLQEFFNGARKNVSYSRQVVGLDGHTITNETAEVTVFVRPGMLESTELVLRRKGNQQPKQEATDLYVHFKLAKSAAESNMGRFERKNDHDLIYTHQVSLIDMIHTKPVQITTLDGRKLLVSLDQIMSPNTVKLVEGEGFPLDISLSTDATRADRL